jgi:spore germination protein YaaH
MITNSSFESFGAHQFLTNPLAIQKALDTLLAECKKNQLYGVQFDFEMIPLADRDALTHFYQMAATLLHTNGFIVSFAVAPRIADDHFPSAYEKKLYDVWQGAYDFKALSAAADFITLMTYDQHGEGTIPGPIASIVWDKKVLDNALRSIPANKLSLGIPTYSGLWYMNMNDKSKRITTRYDVVNFKTTLFIRNKFQPPIIWDDINKIHYMIYTPNVLNRYLFLEDAASVKAKLELANEHHLHSISGFRLGVEDPMIWDTLPNPNASHSFWDFLDFLH